MRGPSRSAANGCSRTPRPRAQALGLAVVYQHPSVLDDLTVTENMLYPLPAGRRPGFAAGRDWTRARMAALGADVDPRARASELTPAERQLLEIARALRSTRACWCSTSPPNR